MRFVQRFPRLAILFSAIYVLTESRERLSWRENAHIIVNGFFYAFLTLEKASNVYYLAFLIFILSVHWRNSLILVCSYLFGLAVFWLIAGQHHLSALPGYFASMSFFIDAYQENLVAEMSERNFMYGLLYCAVAATLIIFRLALSFFVFRTRKQLPVEIFRSALVAALFFLTWKHGMLRGLLSSPNPYFYKDMNKVIKEFSDRLSDQIDAEVMLTTKIRGNILAFVYGDWNHGKQNYGPNDPRKLAAVAMRLSLQETK